MQSFDFHTHSTASDGILNPEALVSSANSAGIETLALTDHDTLGGLDDAYAAASRLGITFIPGVELSTVWSGVSLHIVGLGIDPSNDTMRQGIAQQTAARERRSVVIAQRLAKQGMPDTLDAAIALAGRPEPGRLHFAKVLVEKGYVEDLKQAFKQYLGAAKVGDVKSHWASLADVVQWINAAGGYAVVAHPHRYKLTNAKLGRLLDDFKQVGGQAMEVSCGGQPQQSIDYLAEVAQARGLYASGGSDFHSPEYPWQRLGGFGTLPPACDRVPVQVSHAL